ncbi:MAG: hypothetical protein V4754_00985 [Pseudomonadota bacterium]
MDQQATDNKLDPPPLGKAAAPGARQARTAIGPDADQGALDWRPDRADGSLAHASINSTRSASLLPVDEGDPVDDATFHVAEEVNLDQQSDRVRQIGNLPEKDLQTPSRSVAKAMAEALSEPPAGALADTGKPSPSTQ